MSLMSSSLVLHHCLSFTSQNSVPESSSLGYSPCHSISLQGKTRKVTRETAEFEKDEMSDEEKFEAWKTRAEAIVELGEGQEEIGDDADDGDVSKKWEDWIVDSDDSLLESWSRGDEGSDDRSELDELIVPERGWVKMVRDMVLGVEEDDDIP
ncbi:hypothetical protein F2Q69_00057783 [Brassica cretica]|uniref:Chloroplast envelope membrane protein n=1 Tax=Brassica cretica TaxID=69181 RepID=A0A8S9MZR8_BRACR|nr:hypothetical protein F2Q69_00057783 [Brassica cretica]